MKENVYGWEGGGIMDRQRKMIWGGGRKEIQKKRTVVIVGSLMFKNKLSRKEVYLEGLKKGKTERSLS